MVGVTYRSMVGSPKARPSLIDGSWKSVLKATCVYVSCSASGRDPSLLLLFNAFTTGWRDLRNQNLQSMVKWMTFWVFHLRRCASIWMKWHSITPGNIILGFNTALAVVCICCILHRLVCLNTCSPLVVLFGNTMELWADRDLLGDVNQQEAGFEVLLPSATSCFSLFLVCGWNVATLLPDCQASITLLPVCFPCHDEPQHPLWNCKPEQTLSSLDFLLPGNFYHSTGEVANTGCMWVVWLQTFAMSERKQNVHKKKRVLA